MIAEKTKVEVILPVPHSYQRELIETTVKRVIVRAGRRGGKTVGAAIKAILAFLEGKRVLYAAPTSEQVGKFWYEVTNALDPLIKLGVYKKNESESFIEKPGTEQRIKAKTAWNSDTLRGDYADLLILDEWQLMDEDTWEVVGAPMLLDNNGDAVFIYTPPSLRSVGVSKAHDPRHAAKMFKMAQDNPRWKAIHFTSHDNPYISKVALTELIQDMSKQAYRQEILAEDDEIQLSWLVYKAFNETTNKISDFEIPKNYLIYAGHDFGGANPAALFVAQDPATGNFYEFKEYLPGAGKSTYEHVEEFKRITQGYNVIWRSGGSHQEEEIRQAYTAQGWPISEPKVRGVSPQVDKVVGFMERNKVFIFKSLYNRLEELMNCLWEPDNEGRPTDKIKDEQKYHLCACARYLYSNFMPDTVTIGGDAGMEVLRTDKPWGYEILYALTDRYAGKILHVNKGHRLSLQYHDKKDETIYVLDGAVDIIGKVMFVGESVRITPGMIHRIEAITDSTLLEVSTPELDDVVRLEDDYGRVEHANI